MEQTLVFNLSVDGAPYVIKAAPSRFNDTLQYTVNINDGTDVVFTFDRKLGRYAPVGDNAVDVADNLEIEIGNRLNSKSIAQQ